MEIRALLDTQAAVQETEREKLRVMMNQYQQKAALLADLLQQQAPVAQADNQIPTGPGRLLDRQGRLRPRVGRD